MVVDDNESVLEVVATTLEAENFRVLSAGSGPAAIKLAEETTETIDLLLSDVEMPHMSGPDLGEALKKARPHMHVMLMSGGSNGNLLVLNYGWAYIQKPLVAVKLAQTIKEVLHSQDRSQLGGQEFDAERTVTERKNQRDIFKLPDSPVTSARISVAQVGQLPSGSAGMTQFLGVEQQHRPARNPNPVLPLELG